MKYSHLLGKTKRDISSDEESINAQLLIRGGYVYKEMAGAYDLLPLGKLVVDKIIEIVREEMENIGGQEIAMTSMQNPTLWKETNRWDDEVLDIWFKTKLKNDTEIGLATTHEEPLTNLMKEHINSYRDLPKYVYQFQTKFRNELRAKSGLLRGREFIMKDLYSFNKTEEDLNEFYEKAKQAYLNIFKRVGLEDVTFITFASGGTFSKYSHEFQTLSDVGEDTIYLDRKKKIAINKEVYNEETIKDLDLNKEELEEVSSVEVGNIFKLGTRFSEPLKLKYTNEEGELLPVIMGSYGIGIQRLMATIVEQYHDEKGIVWPESVAPYKVHLVGLNLEDEDVKSKADTLYQELIKNNVEVLYDDRIDTKAGEKFSDADLIGIPYRVVVSKKTEDKIEVKKRNETEAKTIKPEELISLLKLN